MWTNQMSWRTKKPRKMMKISHLLEANVKKMICRRKKMIVKMTKTVGEVLKMKGQKK